MKKETKYLIAWCAGWIVAFVVLMLMFGCSGTTKIEKEYIHDTTRVVDVRYDSVDRWHNHYEYIKGDTVFKVDSVGFDRWHEKHDTIYEKKVEYRDKEVEKEVEKKVYVWWPFAVITALFMAGAGYISLKIKNK